MNKKQRETVEMVIAIVVIILFVLAAVRAMNMVTVGYWKDILTF
jgi:uncharacterized membrane protein